MGNVGVMVEVWRVVVDVGHRHRHGGRAGQALRLPSICCHNQQLVIGPVFSVQQGACDNLSCSWVDGELAVSAGQAVTAGDVKNDMHVRQKMNSFFGPYQWLRSYYTSCFMNTSHVSVCRLCYYSCF